MRCVSLPSPSSSLDAQAPSPSGPWTRTVTPPLSPDPPPPDRAEVGGAVALVTSRAASSGGAVTPLHYKPFSSHAHYQQVMCAVRKLQESGFYWGAVSGRDAGALLRSEPPGTFLIRDSSDHHHFFALSVQTPRGIKNLRIHSQDQGFFLQRDPLSAHHPPRFDCVLKLVAHYMGKSTAGAEGAIPGNGRHVYLIHSGGEKVPLELRRPLCAAMSTLQHMCRRTLNESRTEGRAQIPHTLRDFMEEYDAPI